MRMPPEKNPVISVSDTDFEDIVNKSPLPVLLEFWSPSCSFCLKMAKVLDLLAAEFPGRLVVAKMNVLENAVTPVRFGVSGIPAFFLIRNGEVAGQTVGAMSKGRLKRDLGLDRLS